MTVPKYDEFMKPLLEATRGGQLYNVKDLYQTLARHFDLSSDDLSEVLPSGRQTVFKNRVGWAKTYLLKAGLLESPKRAAIMITDAGKKVLEENPDKIDARYLRRFRSFEAFFSTAKSLNDKKQPRPAVSKPDDRVQFLRVCKEEL